MNYEAIIFDMDGVLVDSQPFWYVAEQRAFSRVNRVVTPEMHEETRGVPTAATVALYCKRFGLPASEEAALAQAIESCMLDTIREKAKEKSGVTELLSYLVRHLPLGIASSSSMEMINVVTQVLKIDSYFKVLHSATLEAEGKPAPDVYLGAARRLGVNPQKCLVFEDAYSGILAARAAGMRCVYVPDGPLLPQARDLADWTMGSLVECLAARGVLGM